MSVTKQPRKARGFHLTVQADGDEYGVTLHETNGQAENTTKVAQVNARQARNVQLALQQAVKASGHARTTLAPTRKTPIPLHEDAGVRLALVLLATERVKKGRRISDITTAIDHMATEEAYYWYAKSTGPDATRVRRALRLFLAEE